MKINSIFKFFVYFTLISTVGIYLIPSLGIRTDTIILFTSFLLSIILVFKKENVKIHNSTFIILFSIISITPIILSLLSQQRINLSLISASEGLLSSLVILIIFSFINFKDINELLSFFKVTSRIFLGILILSTMIATLSMFFDLNTLSLYLWGSESAVGFLAQSNYRYTGLFNLPIEAGIAYTIGVFNLFFVRKYDLINERQILIISLSIIVGGLLSISKVFLLFGLPLIIVFLVVNKNLKYVVSSIMIFTITYYSSTFILKDWDGLDFIKNFINNLIYGDSLIYSLTSSRFGEGSTQQSTLLKNILAESPIFGTGLGSLEIYDSTISLIISSGGLLYLSIFILVILIFIIYYKKFITFYYFENRMLVLYLIFIMAISLGTPIFWLNKVNLYLWLFLLIIININIMKSKEKVLD